MYATRGVEGRRCEGADARPLKRYSITATDFISVNRIISAGKLCSDLKSIDVSVPMWYRTVLFDLQTTPFLVLSRL